MKKPNKSLSEKKIEFFEKIDNDFSFYPGELNNYSSFPFFQQTMEVFEIVKHIYTGEAYSSLLCSHPYEMILDHVLKPTKKSYYMNSYEKAKIINKNNRKSRLVKNTFVDQAVDDGKYDVILLDCHSLEDIEVKENSFQFPIEPQEEVVKRLFNKNLNEGGRLIYVVNPFILNQKANFTVWFPSGLDKMVRGFNESGDRELDLGDSSGFYFFDENEPNEQHENDISKKNKWLEEYKPYLEGIIRLSSVNSSGGPYSPTVLIFKKELVVYDFYVSDLNKIKIKDFLKGLSNNSSRLSKSRLKKSWSAIDYYDFFVGKDLVVDNYDKISLDEFVGGNFSHGLNFSFIASDAFGKGLWKTIFGGFKKRSDIDKIEEFVNKIKNKEDYRLVSNEHIGGGKINGFNEISFSFAEAIMNHMLFWFLRQNSCSKIFSPENLLSFLETHLTEKNVKKALDSLLIKKGDLVITINNNMRVVSGFCETDFNNLLPGLNTIKLGAGKKPDTVIDYIHSFIENNSTNDLISDYVYQNISGTTSTMSTIFPVISAFTSSGIMSYEMPLINESRIESLFNKKGSKKDDNSEFVLILNMLKSSDWEVVREEKVGRLSLDFGLYFKNELVSYLEIKEKLSNSKDIRILQKRHVKTGLEKGIVCFKNNIYVCDGKTFSATSGIPNPPALYPEKYKEEKKVTNVDLMEFLKKKFEEQKEQGKAIKSAVEDVKRLVSLIFKGVEEVKKSSLSVEIKISKIEKHISKIDKKDLRAFEKKVKKWFGYWKNIGKKTRVFMCGAELYFYHAERTNIPDYSAFIISYCKALENELLKKLFLSFIKKAKSRSDYEKSLNLDISGISPSKAKGLESFVRAFKKRFKDEKFTLGEMKEVLKRLPNKESKTHPVFHRFEILRSLDDYIKATSFKISPEIISEIEFITNRFRNKAAHSDYINKKSALVFVKRYRNLMNKVSAFFYN